MGNEQRETDENNGSPQPTQRDSESSHTAQAASKSPDSPRNKAAAPAVPDIDNPSPGDSSTIPVGEWLSHPAFPRVGQDKNSPRSSIRMRKDKANNAIVSFDSKFEHPSMEDNKETKSD